jgi:SAM-dependent methyltransferase
MLNEYGPLGAEFYNITKPIDGEYPDTDYYLRQLKKLRGGPVLEVGVGTGRLFIPHLEAGLKVEGLDSSDIMLEACRRNCAERGLKPVLHKARMERMDLKDRFEAIVVCFGSFQILEERSTAIAALKNFHRHLKPGGKLFIDIDVPHLDLQRAGLKTYGTTVEASQGSQLVLEGTRTYDMVEQIETVHLRYERWRNGKLVDTELQRLPLRWYGKYEFASFLREQSFDDVKTFADYEEGLVPESGCQMYCYVATKK